MDASISRRSSLFDVLEKGYTFERAGRHYIRRQQTRWSMFQEKYDLWFRVQ